MYFGHSVSPPNIYINRKLKQKWGLNSPDWRSISQAAEHLRTSINLNPANTSAMTALAWLLATSPDPEARNGLEAIALAESLCRASQYRHPRHLDILAAACAEAGQFQRAVDIAAKAKQITTNAGLHEQSDRIEQRLNQYRLHKPFHRD